jgi:RimJ/RimL family protein N-acetyltransferase
MPPATLSVTGKIRPNHTEVAVLISMLESLATRSAGALSFRRMDYADIPMFLDWVSRPHVAEWWDDPPTIDELEAWCAPAAGERGHVGYLAWLNGADPIGFIQTYVAVEGHEDGWWLNEHDPGVRGIDQFLANADQLGRGLGTAMVRAFAAKLFEDASVTRIQTDPSPHNMRAIRCYEKAGFHAAGEVMTPDGPALLMYRDRTSDVP